MNTIRNLTEFETKALALTLREATSKVAGQFLNTTHRVVEHARGRAYKKLGVKRRDAARTVLTLEERIELDNFANSVLLVLSQSQVEDLKQELGKGRTRKRRTQRKD
jgi:DNA-binding CsgD family transcriptional regulator